MFIALVIVFSRFFVSVDAGANANCLQAPTWIANGKKVVNAVPSDLNQCQLNKLEDEGVSFKPNDNLIGGEGDSTLFDDIYLGGKDEGCGSTENCMKDCQALCCIVPSCKYAMIKRKEETYCPVSCSIYKEDAYYWYCSLYASGSFQNSDDNTACYVDDVASKANTCPSIAETGFGWNSTTYEGLLNLGTDCPVSVRRELETSEEKIRATVQGALENIRDVVLPGVEQAINEAGGANGFAKQLQNVAKTIEKGSSPNVGTQKSTKNVKKGKTEKRSKSVRL
jgi:hypothetical protein